MIEYQELCELEQAVRDALELHERLSEPCSSNAALREALSKVEAARAPLIRQNELFRQSAEASQAAMASGAMFGALAGVGNQGQGK